jgi:hypothetical protein
LNVGLCARRKGHAADRSGRDVARHRRGKTPDDILATLPDIEEGVAAIGTTLADRRIIIL